MSFWSRLREARLVRILAVYAAASWLVLQIVWFFVEAMDLPRWFVPAAIVLLVIGLIVVSATAWVQSNPLAASRAAREEIPSAWEIDLQDARQSVTRGRLPHLTWARALLGGAVAFALMAAVAVGYLVLRQPEDRAEARAPQPSVAVAKSIAVLPFANLSAEAENEYFSEGITEEILTTLAKIRDLKVISRTSVMRYKDTTKGTREIGRELGVAAVLEGSVRRQGDRVRIAAQLIDTRTDEHLWAETYDRELTDIFAIQSDVAQRIAEALQANLSPADRARLARRPTDDVQAYQLYLQGRYFWNKRNAQSVEKAIELFRSAIDRDPKFALAYSGIAAAYAIQGDYRFLPATEAYPAAEKAAQRALQLDAQLADAYVALGAVQEAKGNFSAAEKLYRRAIDLNPNHATAHHWYAEALAEMGRMDDALREARAAYSLDPLSPPINVAVGDLLLNRRAYDDAIEQLEKTRDISPPDYPWVLTKLGLAYSLVGRHADAVAMVEKAVALVPNDPMALADLATVQARAGATGEARKTLERLLAIATAAKEPTLGRGAGPAFAVALVYASLGQTDQAFKWLGRADRSGEAIRLLRYDPRFDALRSDPRFERLIRDLPS
jgi:TolB-like protein/predicted Zn-dependent protease